VLAAALTCAALGAGPLTSGASAQATRTWIAGSAAGDDANPCSRTAPCKTIAGAISKTASGGEINAADPGGFGAVTITKPITIDFSNVGRGGILNSLTTGVIVNAAADDDVVLRGLDVQGAGDNASGCQYTGVNGIRVIGGRTLRIEDSSIAGQNVGIQLVPTATDLDVLVNRVDVSNVCTFGLVAAPANGHTVDVTVRDSTFTHTGTAISAGAGGHVWLTRTTITGNGTGLDTTGGGVIDSFGDNQVVGNTADGAPSSTLASGLAGPQGPAGASIVGPAGPTGATGPAGPAGPSAYRLLVVLPKKRLTVRAGQGVALSYVSTSAAKTTLQVRKGTKLVATVTGRARLGANTIVWNGRVGRRMAAAGRYALKVLTTSADGQKGSATASLKLTSR
jgi:hypothetical protein